MSNPGSNSTHKDDLSSSSHHHVDGRKSSENSQSSAGPHHSNGTEQGTSDTEIGGSKAADAHGSQAESVDESTVISGDHDRCAQHFRTTSTESGDSKQGVNTTPHNTSMEVDHLNFGQGSNTQSDPHSSSSQVDGLEPTSTTDQAHGHSTGQSAPADITAPEVTGLSSTQSVKSDADSSTKNEAIKVHSLDSQGGSGGPTTSDELDNGDGDVQHESHQEDKSIPTGSIYFLRECHSGKNWLEPQFVGSAKRRIRKPDEVEGDMDEPAGSIDENILNRIRGSMIGMAMGDALGAHVEFRPHEYLVQHPVKDLGSGGTWGLEKGQFTDDTSMALCLANSLIASRGFNPYDQLVRYKWWYELGYMSSTGRCFDIGAATRQSIAEFAHRQERFAHEHKIPLKDMDYLSDPELLRAFNVECSGDGVAGNGALMRLTPVPLFFYRNSRLAVEYSGYSGYITHGDRKAYDACQYYGALIVAALHGYTKDQLLDTGFYWKHREWFGTKELHPDIKSIAEGSYKKNRGYEDGIRGKGYIVNALEAALWAFWDDKNSFEKGALAAVNLGDDTDTTAAIYGQLAGAHYGYDKLPPHWLEHVYARGFMEKLSKWIAYEGECWQKRSDEQTN